ncbi:ankryin domain-containing protein [Colletotrichum kahawae]|uniref:Ankryin domain-containing protein n=1 Tax=Colletotrichum kahawae TaxID=34407 RepID=A0AAD9YG26_COLKA|nr:ankryin domain-containing protein [Colletotrichum kahawae]
MTKIPLLLEAGADVNAMSHGSEQPLERAVFHDQPEVVRCLIEAGAQVTNMPRKQNLLHIAGRLARLEALKYLADMHPPLLNVHQEDDWGDTPWDEFIWALHAPEWNLGASRRPTPQEQDAFVTLYKKLRDRSLELDISRLQRIRQHLEDEIFHGTMTVLQSLISEKRDWEQWDSVRTYETIKLQVRERMVEAALESVDENTEVLQEKIEASPWDQVSRWEASET